MDLKELSSQDSNGVVLGYLIVILHTHFYSHKFH
jgi:hypothetical protein